MYNSKNKLFRLYNFFEFNNDNNIFINDDKFIKRTIEYIEFICNKSSYILTLKIFYNSVDEYNRNILHYLYLHGLNNTFLYYYIINNNLSSEFYVDIYGKKPKDYSNKL